MLGGWLLAHGADPHLRSTATYIYTDGILAAEWATKATDLAGQRAYDLAKLRHNEAKWSSGKFRQVWELQDKTAPSQG